MSNDGKILCDAVASLGVCCLVLGFWLRRKEVAARRWRKEIGKIVTSDIAKQYVGHGCNEFLPIIWYQFTHNGKTYTTDHWRTGNFSSGSMESAEVITKKYSFGKSVNVFVNPSNPDKSVLEHGVTDMSWIAIWFGIGFVLIALLMRE